MDLPLLPPVKPMLAKAATTLPTGDGLFYEPKWDGFRCIVFRDGDEVELGSRNERPLTRYFPEVVEAVKEHLPERCVVDGEIVVPAGDRLHFEALLQRIQDRTRQTVRKALSWSELRPMYVDLYKRSFSREDVIAMAEFYESSAGQSLLDKTPALTQNLMGAIQQKMLPLFTDLQKDLEQIVNTPAAPAAKP